MLGNIMKELLFEANNRSSSEVNKLMRELNEKGVYSISKNAKEFLKDFY